MITTEEKEITTKSNLLSAHPRKLNLIITAVVTECIISAKDKTDKGEVKRGDDEEVPPELRSYW